jgi:hypothetical protein
MMCPPCQAKNDERLKLCDYCGAPLAAPIAVRRFGPLLSLVFIGALGVFVLRGAWNALAS